MELLSIAVAATLAREAAGSALPDAPVVPVRRTTVGAFRRLLAGMLGRRTVATINQED